MVLLLELLGLLSLLELSMWLRPFWPHRRPFGGFLLATVAGTSVLLFAVHPRVWTALIMIFSLYRCFNLSRVIAGRLNEPYLRQVSQRAGILLIFFQLVVLVVMAVDSPSRWYMLGGIQLALSLVLTASLARHVRTTREPLVSKSYTDRDLPTLSVAIPARNETDELRVCLRTLLANNYPKLEVLVVDDCSSNTKTPEIIRSFAHDGVRFVGGSEPGDTWLAKNWAYERLSEEANGELILFCGVDTTFAPDGLRTLVADLLEKDKSMLSVLPHNENTALLSQLLQPVRYGWELALPRRLFQRPPVLSTCWLIKADLLKSAGGFKAVSRSIVPESHFARTAAIRDGYSFIRSNAVTSRKTASEQRATAIRTRYPQLHRRPELVALLTLTELAALIAPPVLFIAALVSGLAIPAIMSGTALLLLSAVWAVINRLTYGRLMPMSLLSLPAVMLVDIGLMHYSMYQYEFSEVVWKGRNVCIPVMHVVSKLPNA